MTSPEIEINADVLRWARESIGYSIDDVAKKTGFSSNSLRGWETKTSRIRYSTVTRLAKAFKRPTVALLLNQPPLEPPVPEYFRRTGKKGSLPSEIRLAIRKARHWQHISKNLEDNIGMGTRSVFKLASLDDDPEKIAERERNDININFETQSSWKDPRKALKAFKAALEKKNIFVFQLPMPTDQTQGFSLTDDMATVITLNSKDIPERRIFTLFHEYAHLLLGKMGVCADIELADPSERIIFFEEPPSLTLGTVRKRTVSSAFEKFSQSHVGNSPASETGGTLADFAIERWCDNFAGAFLAPKEALASEISKNKIKRITYPEVGSIARAFCVSKHMIFVRLHMTGQISSQDYIELSKQFGKEMLRIKESEKTKKKAPGKKILRPSQAKRCLSEQGEKFVSLVMENANKNQITTAKALEYLSVRLDTLPKVEAAIRR